MEVDKRRGDVSRRGREVDSSVVEETASACANWRAQSIENVNTETAGKVAHQL